MNIYSGIAHTLKEGIADTPTAHIIIYQTYLHTLPGLVCQSIGYQISQGVVLYNIGIYMDCFSALPMACSRLNTKP